MAGSAAFFARPDLLPLALQAGQIGVWFWDLASNKVAWSANIERLHGLPEGAFDGSIGFVENEIHPDDRSRVKAAIDAAINDDVPYHVHYRLADDDGRAARCIEAHGTLIRDGGRPTAMLGVCRDVTERERTEGELRERAAQQEAVARLGERALIATNLQSFLDEVVATSANVLGIEFVKILELVPGDAELLLRAGVGWKPGLIGTAHVTTGPESQAGFALAEGKPVITADLSRETRFSDVAMLESHGIVSGMSTAIAGPDRRPYGVLGMHSNAHRIFQEHDIAFLVSVANVVAGAIQRHQLDQRHELMIRELRHRSGNLFSQLLALFSQTAKNSRSVADLTAKYEARVLALANAHRLITEGGWKSTSLLELLRTLLAPYLERVTLNGPDVYLAPDPAFGLSTAVHELVTNASKHGALSQQHGSLTLSWSVSRNERGLMLAVEWIEAGGPPPRRAPRKGFGSRLITMVIERQLSGQVMLSFTPAGLRANLLVPLTHERWPNPAGISTAAL